MGNYYRYRPSSMGFGGFTLTPAVKVLLIVNAVLYIVPALVRIDLSSLALVPRQVLHDGRIWQVFTYMFLHTSFSHFLFNMLTLWMFGTAVEQTWGTRRFASYYLLCGVAAGVCVVAFGSPTIGSSGAIFGLILAFGMLFPDTPVYFMFLFPLPAKYFVMLMAGIEFFLQWAQPGSPVSHLCHLGGLLFGFLYIRFWLPRRRAARSSYSSSWEPEKPPLFARIRQDYRSWRLRRARKKFDVFMRDQERPDERENKDRWVH